MAATLEDAIAHYESDEFRASPEGQLLQLADSGGRELTVDVDALAAFLRVINMLENIRSATVYLARASGNSLETLAQKMLQLADHDLEDVLQVLNEGSIHEEVTPLIQQARADLAAALAQGAGSGRDELIDSAINRANTGRDLMVAVLPPLDTQAPTVEIITPAAGAAQHGLIDIVANASDDTRVSVVVFRLGTQEIGRASATPLSVTLNTTSFEDGDYQLTVTAVDSSNNSATATGVLTIDNASVAPPPDTTPPALSITSPAEGAEVSGTVSITASATDDDSGIASVSFSVNGIQLGEAISPPYIQSWDSEAFADGGQSITVIATDLAGNSVMDSINVMVDNSASNSPSCTVYSCPVPPPPPSEPPPSPVTPDGTSPDGEFEGEVTAVNLDTSTVTVDVDGQGVTVQITSDTVFEGVVAGGIEEVLIGHIAQGEFFQSTGEVVWIEADMPPGF